jgi:hypothetical protein
MSPIQANIMFKKSDNERLTFENMISEEEAMSMEPFDVSMISLIYDRPYKTKCKNQLKFSNYGFSLEPFEQ